MYIVLNVILVVLGNVIGAISMGCILGKYISQEQRNADKNRDLFDLMNAWVKVKQKSRGITEYLVEKGYDKIAVYGMGPVGETLCDEIKNAGLKIEYVIDQNKNNIYSETEMFLPEEQLPQADVIIVTPITYFDEIEKKLGNKTQAIILSLKDIIYDLT